MKHLFSLSKSVKNGVFSPKSVKKGCPKAVSWRSKASKPRPRAHLIAVSGVLGLSSLCRSWDSEAGPWSGHPGVRGGGFGVPRAGTSPFWVPPVVWTPTVVEGPYASGCFLVSKTCREQKNVKVDVTEREPRFVQKRADFGNPFSFGRTKRGLYGQIRLLNKGDPENPEKHRVLAFFRNFLRKLTKTRVFRPFSHFPMFPETVVDSEVPRDRAVFSALF